MTPTIALVVSLALLTSPVVTSSNAVGLDRYIFGIWDISYYGALWLFEGWPSSVFDWDLLFLL